jgi:hypothetical protein
MRSNRQTAPDRCGHPGEVSVLSAGLRRMVCETCGNVRFQDERRLTGRVERSMFARPADQRAPDLNPARDAASVDLRVKYAFGAVA